MATPMNDTPSHPLRALTDPIARRAKAVELSRTLRHSVTQAVARSSVDLANLSAALALLSVRAVALDARLSALEAARG